jgi:hypothetical protein
MADNYDIKDASNTTIAIAADEVSSGVFSPRVTPYVNAEDVSDGSPMPVKGNLTLTSGGFTRPNDTTAYAVGDVVANSTSAAGLTELPNAVRVAGGTGYIVRASFATDQKSNPSSYRIHVYNNTTVTLSNDNAPRRELYADLSKRCCEFVLGPMATPADTTNSTLSRVADNNLRLPISAEAGSTSLWYEVETLTANTPLGLQNFTLRVAIDNN